MKKSIRLPVFLLIIVLLFLLSSCTTSASLERKRLANATDPTTWLTDHKIPSYASTMPLLYNNGVEWNQRSLQLIREAEDYILVSIFLGNLYEVSTDVWHALADKMREGVRVYCLIDSSSNFQTKPQSPVVIPAAMDYLRSLGVPVAEYNAFSLSHAPAMTLLLDRDHRKYWIVDGTYLALGGINVNYASLAHPPESGNIDTMIEVQSPGAIEELLHSFVTTWNRYNPQRLDTADFSVRQARAAETTLWLIDHKWPNNSKTTILFDAFTLGSQEELWMVQGYAFLTKALTNRIINAVDRGVEVHIILSENSGKDNYQGAAYYGMLDLIDAGAHVYLFNDPNLAFLHLKLIVSDQKYSVFGSPNYNFRSQTYSRELAAIFNAEQVAGEAMSHINDLLKHARPVTREEALTYRTFGNYFYYLLMQVWG